MRIDKRAQFWEDWTARVNELYNEVWDALTSEFAPTKYHSDGRLFSQDKGTPAVKTFFDMLENLCEFAERQNADAQKEVDDMQEAEISFEAWSLGLCPKIMNEYRLNQRFRFLGEAGDRDTWPQIAKCKSSADFRQDSTIDAVELWRRLRLKAV